MRRLTLADTDGSVLLPVPTLCEDCGGSGVGLGACTRCKGVGCYILHVDAVRCTVPGPFTSYDRSGHNGGQHYTRKRHKAWERKGLTVLRNVWRRTIGTIKARGPLVARVTIVYSLKDKGLQGQGRVRRETATHDVDNVAKLVLDTAKKAGWFVDDRHVQKLEVERFHVHETTEGPSLALTLWRV